MRGSVYIGVDPGQGVTPSSASASAVPNITAGRTQEYQGTVPMVFSWCSLNSRDSRKS